MFLFCTHHLDAPDSRTQAFEHITELQILVPCEQNIALQQFVILLPKVIDVL